MSSILFEVRDTVAYITLNRPEKYNAFNREMALLFQDTLDECKHRRDIRCVHITGSGKAFSTGQDLAEAADPNGPDVSKILLEHFNPIVLRIRKLNKPVVAAVNGVAAGAGANIALCCDVVVAAQSASFIQAFSKVGLIPDSGGTFFLPRLVGWGKASALAMLGEKVEAMEAERIGMIYKVYEDASFSTEANDLALKLSQMPTRGLALTKQAFNQSFVGSYEDQLHDEELLQQRAGATHDYREGVQAFLEKRSPNFTGE